MKINIISVGKIKESYFLEAMAEYEKRISRFCKINSVVLPDKKIPDSPSEGECKKVLKEKSPDITFVIGGSLGLSDEVKSRADFKLSLGKMTLPHRIARLVLEEQIYRAFKINANEKYHK